MDKNSSVTQIPEPAIARLLFADTRIAVLWLFIRAYVGWQWLSSGIEKVQNPLWVGPDAGGALKGFVMGALEKTGGAHPSVQSWYGDFLNGFVLGNVQFFSHTVAFGEVLVGLGLILGIFTGIAAFFGAFMNMNFLLAGTVSINPILFLFQLFLILAWRVAGWWGGDRYLLPILGTPWQKGSAFKSKN